MARRIDWLVPLLIEVFGEDVLEKIREKSEAKLPGIMTAMERKGDVPPKRTPAWCSRDVIYRVHRLYLPKVPLVDLADRARDYQAEYLVPRVIERLGESTLLVDIARLTREELLKDLEEKLEGYGAED